MKILITGASGLLGKYLIQSAPEDAHLTLTWFKNVYGIDTDYVWYHLDIRERANVHDVFQAVQPDVVIHCAANGSVDYAESHYDNVHSVNFDGTKNIVDAAYLYGAKVVYISTNAVFSGDSPPYDETSAMRPVNNYGLIKMRAEMYTATMAKKWLVIRPFLLYGWPNTGGRNNWVNAIVESLKRENNFSLVDDVIWQPTYALDCAETIWKLLDHDNEIFNVASPESATLYEFGLHICDAFELDKNLLKAVSSAAFEGMAARPKNTTYDLLKLSQAGVMLPDIKTGLEKMKNEL